MKSQNIVLLMILLITVSCTKSPSKVVTGMIGETNIEIKYSSPSVKGRTIFGELVPYAKVWRAGANENTTIEFDKAVTINGNALIAGTYGFFIIPNKDNNWVAIFSKKNDAWGSSEYKETDDALRASIKVKKVPQNIERLNYEITPQGVQFSWADSILLFEVK